MITTKEEATIIILNYLNPEPIMTMVGDEYAVVNEHTIVTKYGWVFHVVSKRFLETKDPNYQLLGQYPMIVEKIDGSVHTFGGAGESIQTALREYEFQKIPTFFNKIRLFISAIIDIIIGRQIGFPNL